MIKEIQAMVRNYLDNPDSGLAHSSRKWSGFVCLLEQNPEGKFPTRMTPPSSLRSQLSNKTFCTSFGARLPTQPDQNLKLRNPGQNPAKGRKGVCLVDLLSSNIFQTLGHE